MKLAWIILSRDRAMQLDALLRSLALHARNAAPVYIYYIATDAAHRAAYFDVFRRHAQLVSGVVVDNGFRAGLRYLVGSVNAERIAFLMDDQVFVRATDLERALIFDPRQAIFSFRLGSRITECQPLGNLKTPPPRFHPFDRPGYLVWRWREGRGDWGCRQSLDGNVFLRSQVIDILSKREFHGPQSLEAALDDRLLTAELGVCEESPSVVNLAINRVSTEAVIYPSGDCHTDVLLEQWVKGFQMDVDAIAAIPFSACHAIIDLAIQARGRD